jgi:hypothetical protein
MLIDATLYIAQDIKAASDMVAEVTERLHNLTPGDGIVVPAAVAVELGIVLDKRFDQGFRPRPFGSVVNEFPYLGNIYLDSLVDGAKVVEVIDDFKGLVHGFDVKGEVVGLENGSRLEPLGDTCLALAGTLGVFTLGDVSKSALGKGVL